MASRIGTKYRAGIVATLEASENLSEILSPKFEVKLPPSSSISTFWSDSQRVVALPHGSQITITSRLQAIVITYALLQSILRSQNDDRSKSITLDSDAYEVLLPWILDSCLALWQSFTRSCARLDRGQDA